jgi:uncharacterized membrane protein
LKELLIFSLFTCNENYKKQSLGWAVVGLVGLVRVLSLGLWVAVLVIVIGISGVT